MSEIRSFPAIRYSSRPSRDISARLAPPYDVLDEAEKRAFLAQDARNFVAVDLPHMPPKAAGPAEIYEAAAREMQAWLADGTLVQDKQPAIYVYHQHFEHQARSYTRKMFFARLRLEPFGQGSVFPHEQTFGGPKEDRLALTKATRANMSPIFGLYPDGDNVVAKRLEAALAPEPLIEGRLQDTYNKVWAVTDSAAIDAVRALMADKPIFIADGHHRYGTAMLYRDWLASQHGPLSPDHPANFVLCVCCAMEDPGLLILPTHRVLAGVDLGPEQLKYDERVEIAHLLAESPEQAVAKLAAFGPQALALYSAVRPGYFMVRPRSESVLDDLEPRHSPSWRKLGLAFLHAYLIDRVVTAKMLGGRAPDIHYVKAAGKAIDEARAVKGTAALMQATTMEELRSVCQAGELMPQKSTYFYPKLASGLVINPLFA
jgi:uncharacterized protein (DUF1015 family)